MIFQTNAPNKTFLYDAEEQEWLEVAEMPTGRFYLMCGLAATAGKTLMAKRKGRLRMEGVTYVVKKILFS